MVTLPPFRRPNSVDTTNRRVKEGHLRVRALCSTSHASRGASSRISGA